MKPPVKSPSVLHALAAWCLGAVTCVAAAASQQPVAPSAQRIVFLGDSITYGGQYVEFFEAFARMQWPQWPGEILNLGLPSETVSGLSETGHAGGKFPRPDLHERLDRVLARAKPDLIFACYGMNDGIYLPFDEERFQRFREGMRRLRDKAAGARARVLLLTPPTFDASPREGQAPPAHNYNAVLDRYSDWLLTQRSQGWTVCDVHGPMTQHLESRRKREPAYRLADDGVHPKETGHWLMGRALMVHFGAPAEFAEADSVAPLMAMHSNAPAILRLVQLRQRLLKDAWLTETGHQRPGMNKGLPLAEAQQRAAELEARIRALHASPPSP